jgi:uncharacterized protein (TIGR03083 family)
MGRPTSKPELMAAAEHEFDRLWAAVRAVSPSELETPGACDSWSVKDILAHLDARGDPTSMPDEGFTWAQTSALNARIHADTAGDPWDEVCDRLRDSYARIVAVLSGYSDDDLFAKKRYRWTGSTSVGSYTVSATSSHYAWASGLIRRWLRGPG